MKMPAKQQGQPYRLGRGRWGLRYYDNQGVRRRVSGFPSMSAARAHFRDVIEPELRGEQRAVVLTLRALVDVFLERHTALRSPRTIQTLRERLCRPLDAYGDVPLHELEGMSGDLADFAATLPERYRYSVMSALRQTLAAGVRYGHMSKNPATLAGPNPQPRPRPARAFTIAELDALEVELGNRFGPIVPFAAATGLRPAEWARLERRDVDKERRVITVRGTKTDRSLREVPLTGRALAALDRIPPRIDTPLQFPAPRGDVINLDNFRKREWAPAVETSGIHTPARIYDLRSTFASNALAAGVTVFELARVMGTSVAMIERHYGALLDGAHAGIAGRLDSLQAKLEKAEDDAKEEPTSR
jgi:integrase